VLLLIYSIRVVVFYYHDDVMEREAWIGVAYYAVIAAALLKTSWLVLRQVLAISRNMTLHEYLHRPYEVPSNGLLTNAVLYVSHHLKQAKVN
jgi:hypothetical protein